MSTAQRRWVFGSRCGVRTRLALIAVVVVTLALGVGGVVSILMLHRANTDATYRATSRQAYQIATAINRGGLNAVDADDLASGAGVDFVQVVDRAGTVLASSPGSPSAPVLTVAPDDGVYVYRDDLTLPGLRGEYYATALGTEFASRAYTVIAVDRTSGMRRSEWMTAAILAIEVPIIVGLVAVAVYFLVGRTLRPVSRITGQVNEITATQLERRVPVPDADDEIRTLATTMNGMLGRLEANRAAQLRFVGDASHELRSPLTTVVGLLDLAAATGTTIDAGTIRAILLPEARQMQRIVDDLLLLARADEGGLTISPVDVDLDDVVLAEATRLRAVGAVDVRVRVIAARVVGDPDMIARAVRNLTDNAIRYAHARVWLLMDVDEQRARIFVGDDGPGIDTADAERVFERFARLGTDRRADTGTGLGLAIVREIMRAHGGHVKLVTGGKAADNTMTDEIIGAFIELEFPLAQQDPQEPTVSDADASPGGQTRRSR